MKDFEDKAFQTLVEDNSLKEKIVVLPISSVIINLKNFIKNVNKEIEDFRKFEDDRLEEISNE